ncbi:MAG: creatininase family protein [Planctomycetales bacterium]
MRPWILSETNYAAIKARPCDVAVLPMGATEPHNLHLPYGTDTLESMTIGERACAAAHARGARVILLPPIPYGTETNLHAFPLAMNLNPSTLLAVIRDLVQSLERSGVLKLLILNGHGGNDFKPLLRELHLATRVHLFLCDWFRGISADVQRELFREPGDHAGAMETAFALACFPEFVARDPATGELAADDGTMRPTQFEAVNRGWVSITRPWHLLTTNTGAGNPREATCAKGEQLVDTIVSRLADFLVKLAQTPLDQHFPFCPED